MSKRGKRQLRPGQSEWGKRRVSADLSLRDVASLTGINSGLLSMLDQGRYVPTPEEAAKLLHAYEHGREILNAGPSGHNA